MSFRTYRYRCSRCRCFVLALRDLLGHRHIEADRSSGCDGQLEAAK